MITERIECKENEPFIKRNIFEHYEKYNDWKL